MLAPPLHLSKKFKIQPGTMKDSTSQATRILSEFLKKNPAVNFVRFQWVDFSGVLKAQIVPIARCTLLASSETGLSTAKNCMIVPIAKPIHSYNEGPQKWELCPDWKTIRLCGFAPKHASIMCYTVRVDAAEPLARCTRHLLENLVSKFEEEHTTKILVGFEIEFMLLNDLSQTAKPLDRITTNSTMGGLRGHTLTIMEEIVEALEASDIGVYKFHTEGLDQLELVLPPLPPMIAVDVLMFAQETIRTIGIRHNLKATMAPRAVFDGQKNGCHVHLSLSPAPATQPFLAGILHKLGPLCAFGLASYDSYSRIRSLAAGRYVGWGTESRDMPIRQISDNHWEFRFPDATANMFLVLASLLSAGSAGISQNAPLTWKDCSVSMKNLGLGELGAYGIVDQLPAALETAVELAKNDKDIAAWIGQEMLDQYVQLKETEIQAFSKMTDDERRRRFLMFF